MWLGLVAVLLDLIIKVLIAAVAIWVISAPIHIAAANEPAAAIASAVIIVKAPLTEREIVILHRIVYPDCFPTVVTGDTMLVHAILTEKLIVYPSTFTVFKLASTNIADSCVFFHFQNLQTSIIPIRLEVPYRNNNTYFGLVLDTITPVFAAFPP